MLQKHAVFVEPELKTSETSSRFEWLIRVSQLPNFDRIGIPQIPDAIARRRDSQLPLKFGNTSQLPNSFIQQIELPQHVPPRKAEISPDCVRLIVLRVPRDAVERVPFKER